MPEQFPNPKEINKEKEKIKEEVERFKERTEGLNPDMFAIPGEGSLEKEDVSEEMVFAYELEGKIAEFTKKARLVKDNALEDIESDLSKGQTNKGGALDAISGLSALINSSLWQEISVEKQEELIKKARLVKDNAFREIEPHVSKGQTDQKHAWNAMREFSDLINFPLWLEVSKDKQVELIEKVRLVKDNALEEIESYFSDGQINSANAWNAIIGLSSLIHSPLWSEISKEKQIELIKKAKLVKESFLREIESDLRRGQVNKRNSRLAIRGLSSLITLKDYLFKIANQKLKEQEHQKALHPKKDIPPRPGFPNF